MGTRKLFWHCKIIIIPLCITVEFLVSVRVLELVLIGHVLVLDLHLVSLKHLCYSELSSTISDEAGRRNATQKNLQ